MTARLSKANVCQWMQAKELLGWEPKVSLREGLASMVEDFRERLHLDEKSNNHKAK